METSNVFNTPPPEFNQEEVLDILLKYYNIDCSIENLVSDRDQNFKIISKHKNFFKSKHRNEIIMKYYI